MFGPIIYRPGELVPLWVPVLGIFLGVSLPLMVWFWIG